MIHCVIGTRAQLIKMAPLIVEMEKRSWTLSILYTGQHTDSFLELYKDFNIKTPLTPLLTAKEISTIPKTLIWLINIAKLILTNQIPLLMGRRGKNDIVLVHGDTLSTIIGALASKRNGIKVGHIESGLRSFNLLHPFPEEIIRLLTFRLSDIAFCPSTEAHNNLSKYRNLERVNTHGNTIIDALNMATTNPRKRNYDIPKEKYGIISIHRFENIYKKDILTSIVNQLITISRQYRLVFILHPATKNQLHKLGLISALSEESNIDIRDRTGYFNFVDLLRSSTFVITDGGSNQEELDQLNIPTFLMRKATERSEGLNKNIVLGGYSTETLNTFLKNIGSLCTKTTPLERRPTDIILNHLTKYSSDRS